MNLHLTRNVTPVVVYVEVLDSKGNSLGHYWMNYNIPEERRTLGLRCKDAFEEGGQVFTSRVSKYGQFPTQPNLKCIEE